MRYSTMYLVVVITGSEEAMEKKAILINIGNLSV
jgi:hypothetical protein